MDKRHILLTTDLSEESQRAFEPVGDLARLIDANVTLLHVVQVLTPTSQAALMGNPITASPTRDEHKTAADALELQAKLLPQDVDVDLQVIGEPDIARAITEYAQNHEVGLIALSTHGRSGLRRLVLGSIAEAVLRHSNVPVLCFPPNHG